MASRRSLSLLHFSAGILLLFILPPPANAQDSSRDIVIRTVTGLVEIRHPGESWVPAVEGSILTEDTVISTSFDSSATIFMGDRGIIEVQSLSRLTILELEETAEIISTDLYLDFGRVDAGIRTGGEVEHDFSLRTSVSVASVRGTRFIGDGESWTATEGTVRIENRAGRAVTIRAGESMRVMGLAAPLQPQVVKEDQSTETSSTNPVGTSEDSLLFVDQGLDSAQTIVTISWL